MALTLVTQGNLTGQPILISPHDFYDARSGLSLPFALLLREKMIAEMKKNGVRVLLPGVDEDRFMILQGTWQKQNAVLYLNMKVMKLAGDGPEAVSAAATSLPLDSIDRRLLTPDRESWARYLVRKLEDNDRHQERLTVHIRNFKIVRAAGAVADREGYFSGLIRTALIESRRFQPLDQVRGLKNISLNTMRYRGVVRRIETRPVSRKQPPTGLTTDLLMAEAELTGTAWVHEKNSVVEIRVQVKKSRGPDLTSASADIPSNMFPDYIIDPPVSSAVPPAPPTVVNPAGNISINGLTVDLTTTRGEQQPFYRKGEQVRLVIRLNRVSQLYLFDLGPNGEASLIYPVDPETGRLDRGVQLRVKPGEPLILPEDGASYEMIAEAPFGTDTVWAVASADPLYIPDELTGKWAVSSVLVEHIRRQGLSVGSGYAESQVEVITGP